MKSKLILLSFIMLIGSIAMGQTDTTAKLNDVKNLWATYTNGDPNDTTQFAAIANDCISVLGIDSLNTKADQSLGDVYNFFGSYWLTLSQSLQGSNPALASTYMLKSSYYNALATPYLQRYLRVKGINH